MRCFKNVIIVKFLDLGLQRILILVFFLDLFLNLDICFFLYFFNLVLKNFLAFVFYFIDLLLCVYFFYFELSLALYVEFIIFSFPLVFDYLEIWLDLLEHWILLACFFLRLTQQLIILKILLFIQLFQLQNLLFILRYFTLRLILYVIENIIICLLLNFDYLLNLLS